MEHMFKAKAILGLDAYEAHKTSDLKELAWSRGYIHHEGTMISGGATGVVQGPDTDLHGWLENELIALQEMEQVAKLLGRPNKVPSETRQSMSDYATTLWQLAGHSQGEAVSKGMG